MHQPFISRVHPRHNSGTQNLYRFTNGYGASVIQTPYSYGGDRGLWELAVIKFDADDYSITCETDVTNDVIGYMTPEEVQKTLDQIAALPA